MPPKSSIPVPGLAQRLDSIEAAINTSEGDLHRRMRHLRSKLEVLDEEMDVAVTNYEMWKDDREELATEINNCEHKLAKSFAAGDLTGITDVEQYRERLINDQRIARDEASSALHELGQVARSQQKCRQVIAELDAAAMALTKAVQASSTIIDVDDVERSSMQAENGWAMSKSIEWYQDMSNAMW
ncbi:hypothetical protein VMCG_02041 [Cytospora schulzeri]|uniref:Uncharacterized protein n=1 Tax=Cytospora schulzeri TaxID=448051 RepID=A0A423X320_9PEZI|nr:hypothetical protein VMCG_02041 [Valsa malicola]